MLPKTHRFATVRKSNSDSKLKFKLKSTSKQCAILCW